MSKTYAEIEARVQENINSTVADVSICIDNAIDFLGNFYENKKIDSTIATVANQDYIDRPDLCKEVERLEIAGEVIKKGTVEQIQEIKDFELSKFVEYDGKINIYPTPTAINTTKIWFKSGFTPLAGVAGAVSDVPDELIPLLVSIATWFFLEQQENMYDYEGADGWISVTDAWTFLSDTDNPTFTITVPAGATSRYDVGMRVKLVQTTTKYFLITKVENTKLTVFGGTDYVLTNAIISQIKYSTTKVPKGFPIDEDKWSVIVEDTTDQSQASPSNTLWYNLGGLTINVPIGKWKLGFSACPYSNKGAVTTGSHKVSLSTSSSSESDTALTKAFFVNNSGVNGASMEIWKQVAIAVKTPYYLIMNATVPAFTSLNLWNSNQKCIIKAISIYL